MDTKAASLERRVEGAEGSELEQRERRLEVVAAAETFTGQDRADHAGVAHDLRSGFAEKQLVLLAVRANELTERVLCYDIAFADAVDMAYSAAVWSGLANSVGDDVVQHILAAAFGKIPPALRRGDAP